jgi:hypothetical protein
MLLEVVAAALVGLAALWVVLQPLIAADRRPPPVFEPLDPEETPRGIALAALKEIDFDWETGKLSDGDHDLLKAKYTSVALEALRAEASGVTPDAIEVMVAARVRTLRAAGSVRPECPTCGPQHEPHAVFCSSCGLALTPAPLPQNAPRSGAPPLGASAVASDPLEAR